MSNQQSPSPFSKIMIGFVTVVVLCSLVTVAAVTLLLTSPRLPDPYSELDVDYRPELEFSPPTLESAKLGDSYSATITVAKNETPVGAFLVDEQTLPPGLTLIHNDAESTATLSGTPTEAGTFTFAIDVWCYGTNVSGQTGQITYTLTVEK